MWPWTSSDPAGPGVGLGFHETIVEAADRARPVASWPDSRSRSRLVMVRRNLADDDSRREAVRGQEERRGDFRDRVGPRAVALGVRPLRGRGAWAVGGVARPEIAPDDRCDRDRALPIIRVSIAG